MTLAAVIVRFTESSVSLTGWGFFVLGFILAALGRS